MKRGKRALCLLLCCSLLLSFSAFSAAAAEAGTYKIPLVTSDLTDSVGKVHGVYDQGGQYVTLTRTPENITLTSSNNVVVYVSFGATASFGDFKYVKVNITFPEPMNLDHVDSRYAAELSMGNRSALSDPVALEYVEAILYENGENYRFSARTLVDCPPLSTVGDVFQSTLVPFSQSQLADLDFLNEIELRYYYSPEVTLRDADYLGFWFSKNLMLYEENVYNAITNSTDRVVGEIQSATSSVNGTIRDSTAELKSQIAESTTQVTDKIEESTGEIIENQDENTEEIKDAIEEQTEEQKGMFERLLDGIIEGLKSLFIPGDVTHPETGEQVSYFTLYFEEWDNWMNDHFGVLYFPFAIFFDLCDRILSFTPPANPTITFPELTIMGQTLLEPIEYNFETFPIPWLQNAHEMYLFAADAIIGFWLVRLAYKKLSEIMGGGS